MVIVGQFAQAFSEQLPCRPPAPVIAPVITLPMAVAVADEVPVLSPHLFMRAWNDGINGRMTAKAGQVVSEFDQNGSRLVIDAQIDMVTDLDLNVIVDANEIILTYIDTRRSRFRRFVALMAKMGASWALHELRPSVGSRPNLCKPQGGTAYFAGATPDMTAMLLTQVAMVLASMAVWTDQR